MSLHFNVRLPRRNFELDLSARFERKTIGIFGPSGAGKTSLFSLLAGLERPTAGRIVLNDRVITDVDKKIFLPPNKRRIGVVFQEKLLFPHLTVRENILFGERYVQYKKISLDTVIGLLDLEGVINSTPDQISGGEQQRTAIGRALLTSPELLLLDEPFNAVDSTLRKTILPYLRKLRDELDIPILVISHDLPDIQRLTNLVYLIDSGKCRGYGDILELFGKDDSFSEDVGLVNTFSLYNPDKVAEGLYDCCAKDVTTGKIRTPTAPADQFTMVIQPNEIALSKEYVRHTSIQNQLPGTIRQIIHRDNYVYCLIDTGIMVVAKITSDSEKRLDLTEGDNIFCLFKAHALSM